jgi:hypothetical protein
MTQSGMARNWGNQQQNIGELFEGLPHELSREEKFEQFVRDNPAFVKKVCERALAEYAMGARRGGMKQYFEDFRKDSSIVFNGKYRLNNDFTSLMARLVMKRYPQLEGFFETRGTWDKTRKVPIRG